MMFRALLTAFFVIAGSAWAETPRPNSTLETLTLLKEAYLAHAEVDSAKLDRSDLSLKLKIGEIDWISYPDNLHIQLRQAETDEDRGAILSNFVSAVITKLTTPEQPMKLTDLMPVLRPKDLLQSGLPMISYEFGGNALTILVEDSANTVEYATKEKVENFDLTDAQLYKAAVSNLAEQAKTARIEPFSEGLQMVILDGFYESSLLLLPGFWRSQIQTGETLIAIIPARDVLIFGNKTDAGSVQFMRSLATKMHAEFSHTITPHVFEWDGNTWR